MAYDATTDTWTLKLNRYQRENLLSVINAVGYPHGQTEVVEPLPALNTGDWIGEIYWMLLDGDGSGIATRQNANPDELRRRIEGRAL